MTVSNVTMGKLVFLFFAMVLLLAFLRLQKDDKKQILRSNRNGYDSDSVSIEATQGWSPFFHLFNGGNGIYTLFIEKDVMMRFFDNRLVVSNDKAEETIFTLDSIENLSISPMDKSLLNEADYCISFRRKMRNYYFYTQDTSEINRLMNLAIFKK